MIENDLLVVDCFCGAGGLSHGLLHAGFNLAFAFDSDGDAVNTYNRNIGAHAHKCFSHEVSCKSIIEVVGQIRSGISVVIGGPPCQGFSVQRRGEDKDVRNQLVLDYMRIVFEIRPTMFLMENVSAIAGRRGADVLAEVRSLARREGYLLHEKLLNAADYGVPQHRRRVFIVGEIDDGATFFSFPKPTLDSENHKTVRDAIGDLPTPQKYSTIHIPNHEPDNISELNKKRISYVPEGGGRQDIPPDLRLPCHSVSVDKAGHRGVYGRLSWDEPSGTITTKCNSFTRGRFAHPVENRNISMREAARLQGFPDTFVFTGDKVAVAHQIGNAVPPPLARAIGDALFSSITARIRGDRPKLPSGQLLLGLR